MRPTRIRYVVVVEDLEDPRCAGCIVGIVGPYLDLERARAERRRWRQAGYPAAVRSLQQGAELRREQRERAEFGGA